MNITRRGFLGGATALSLSLATGCACKCNRAKVAVQLYSIRDYIKKVGLEKALADVAAIGYKGVEFAGYYNFKAKEIKKMLDDNGLVACGTHVGRTMFAPDKFKETCEFNLEYGNSFICCPGGGNRPDGYKWNSTEPIKDDWWKFLVDFYNRAAEDCGSMGCKIGLHNHQWEFQHKLANGQLMWDYFFSNTDKRVQMEQDVGWTTCAGFDPCEQYRKYPGRSFTLHAKENGMGKGVKEFNAILGEPGKPGAKGVEWDRLFPISDADGVKWYVVECERLGDTLNAVKPSIEFLRSKGRC
jgi:sugar phosphate isomerase/epimerase